MHFLMRRTLACVLSCSATALSSRAQCLEWSDRFWTSATDGAVFAMTVFDDGNGPALYVGGSFGFAGSTDANGIAKWDGATWSPLGSGMSGGSGGPWVSALCVFDDGTGPALYAGGDFASAGGASSSNVAKWNGSNWSPVSAGPTGASDEVRALHVFDDGSGPALYAGGAFLAIDGVSASRIAKWDGASWTALTSGVSGTGANVRALAVFDDGDGPGLYVGGRFASAGGVAVSNLARWDGSSWSDVGGGTSGSVFALTVFDDGTGPALYAGGDFFFAGGMLVRHIAKFSRTLWTRLGTPTAGTNSWVTSLTVFDDGSGPALYAGGNFVTAGDANANRAARWDGSSWSSLGSGTDNIVRSLAVFDSGGAPALYAGGTFTHAGSAGALRLAEWNGVAWSALDGGNGLSFSAEALLVFDDGSGSALYAGGDFTSAGHTIVNGIASWDGASWDALGSGMNEGVNALTAFDDGAGPALFAAGAFTAAGGASALRVARWDGASWSPLGSGIGGEVNALAAFDDGTGPALYAGGYFTIAGGASANRIAKWDGVSWSALGSGVNNVVRALCVFDDGSGPALYVGGDFTSAGGTPANYLAKWDGSAWSAVDGPNARVFAFTVYDDGSGAALYVGGEFGTVRGVSASCIARWDGSNWSSLGSGTNSAVNALTGFDDGSGPALYAGGLFNVAGDVSSKRIAKWDGASWSPLAGGMETYVRALAVFDDGADGAPDLFAGGWFVSADEMPSVYIAQWHGCPPGDAYCFGDGLDPVVTADCPCSNFGDPGHGCANSNPALGGARLWATGTTSPNTLLFTCEGINNNALATFWRGTANTATGGVVHDGIQCLGGTTIRFGQQYAGQFGNPPYTVSAGTVAMPPGSTRYYQVLYRNPAPGFCPPGQYNWSNGYIVTW